MRLNLKKIEDKRLECGESANFIKLLFDAVLDSKGIQGVLSHVRSCCGVGFAFFDQKENTVFVESSDENFSERCRFYPLAEVLRLYPHWSIERAGTIAFLVADEGHAKFSHLEKVVPHVINALLLCKLPRISDVPRPDEKNFLERLIMTGEDGSEDLARSLNQLGLGNNPVFFTAAVSVRLKNERRPLSGKAFSLLSERYGNILQSSGLRVISGSLDGCFAAAFFCEHPENASFLLKNIETVTRHFEGSHEGTKGLSIRIGCGDRGFQTGDFARSYREATVAIRHAVLNEKETVLNDWREIGADCLLAAPYVNSCENERLYSPLTELRLLQKMHTTPFFSTIVALIRNHWNITKTASRLCLHYNSMKYRYDRVGEILKLDIDDPRNRFELSMLVRSYLYAMPLEDFFEIT